MRRSLAGLLVVFFLTQSSGVALADNARPVASISFAALFQPIELAIVSSRLYADITGSGDRYTAMHAARPVLERKPANLDAAGLMRKQHALRPHPRKGTRAPLILPPRRELAAGRRVLDPRAMRPSSLPKPADKLASTQATTPIVSQSLRMRGATMHRGVSNASGTSTRQGGIKPMAAISPTTGIEHWWTYEERAIPGIGKAMLNVGTGNFLVSAMDVDQTEQGLDLAFQRVYNSQSLHDVNGDDGGEPAIFGNGWTNTFDANIVYAPAPANTITVNDIDGGACTYTSNGNGSWQPCAGEYATLAPTSGSCTYTLTKPNGTIYVFQPDGGPQLPNCGPNSAFAGHLVEIIGRNNQNAITFQYSYDSSGIKNSEHVTEIDAIHSDGDQLTMTFGIVPGTSYNELASIERPDHALLNYWYGVNGNLLEVDKPGNNSATSGIPHSPNSGAAVQAGDVPETYSYAMGVMNEACGPRCTVAMWNNPSSPNDGSALLFTVSNNNLMSWSVQGVLNFTPNDGTSTPLQNGPSTGFQTFYTATFDYGNAGNCSNDSGGATTMCDTDGHATSWTLGNNNRVIQTQDWSAGTLAVTTSQTWDASNNLLTTTDPNGNTTQYGYDTPGFSQGGNVVEVQLPSVSDLPPGGSGSVQPLSYYSYDQHNNVVAYCDPVYNQTNGNTWQTPSDSLCPSGGKSAPATFQYTNNDPNEPYGCLHLMTKPGGYTTTITYGGACGIGLPAKVAGQQISQYDNSSRTPTQDFTYNGQGGLTAYDRGQHGGTTFDSWNLTYDPNNRNIQRIENEVIDGNAQQLPHWSCYYPDGSLLYTETPSQHHADGGGGCPSTSQLASSYNPPPYATAYWYDTDGDELRIVDHKTNTAQGNMTEKFYDGLDRLVETIMPTDQHDCYTFLWMNRYIYDLSQSSGGAVLHIGNVQNIAAYGNLYKTEEYLPGNPLVTSCSAPQGSNWTDVRGASFDGLDRALDKYELAYGNAPYIINTYDASNQSGLLSAFENGIGQTITYSYDNIMRVKELDFGGPTPLETSRQYTYDADGRVTSRGNISYTFDVDGNVSTESDSPNENNASTITYSYYPDGKREYLSVKGQAQGQGLNQNDLFSYAYQTDGRLVKQAVNWAASGTFSWVYTPMGREVSQTDPLNGNQVTTTYWQLNNPKPLQKTHTFKIKSYDYDSFGRINSLVYPQGYRADSMIYDEDDELWGYSYSEEQQNGDNTKDAATRNFVLTTRGELLSDQGCAGGTECSGLDYSQSANGTLVDIAGKAYGTNAAQSFDARSGMTWTNLYRNGFGATASGGNNTYFYDSAGRQNEDKLCTPNGQYNQGCFEYDRSYDADNHLVQAPTGDACNPNNFSGGSCYYTTANLSYGADGQLRGVCQNPSGQSCGNNIDLHWDGTTLLFTGTASGGPGTLYIGKLATMTADGSLMVADRNQNGVAESFHSTLSNGTSGYGPWVNYSYTIVAQGKLGFPLDYQTNWGSCGGVNCAAYPDPPTAMNGLAIDYSRADGYSYGPYAVQGVRSYDSTSQQWLTPDAFAGNVNNPMSQKPFIWNSNNPVLWSDPTGFSDWPDEVTNNFAGAAPKLTDAGTSGSACAATDASGDCFQENTAIRPQPNTKMNGYKSIPQATAAAKSAYAFIFTKGEVGCLVYCVGSDCGFGDASVTRSNPDLTANLAIVDIPVPSATITQAGIWHTHPEGAPRSDMEGHNAAAQWGFANFHVSEFPIFTSEQGMPMQWQPYQRYNADEYLEPSNAPQF